MDISSGCDVGFEYEIKRETKLKNKEICMKQGCDNDAVSSVEVGRVRNSYGAEYYLCADHIEDALEIYLDDYCEKKQSSLGCIL